MNLDKVKLDSDLQSVDYLWPVFIIAFLLAVAQVLLVPPHEMICCDMLSYLERAQRWAAGGPPQPFDAFFPPGVSYFYSLFFWLFTEQQAYILIAVSQCLLLSLAAVAIAATAAELSGSSRVGIVTGLVSACYWPFTLRASFFLSEPLFICLATLGQYGVVRAMKGSGSHKWAILAGVSLGFSLLTRSQGVCFIVSGLFALLIFCRGWRRVSIGAALFLPVLIIVYAQMRQNQSISGRSDWFISANDGFNLYLGQSRREAVMGVDFESQLFHVFYNDNSVTPYLFHPPIALPFSVMDREHFVSKVHELWQSNPSRQTWRSLENMVELWSVRGTWPVSNFSTAAYFELVFLWIGAILFCVPALLYSTLELSGALWRRRQIVLVLPAIVLTASAFASSGQPRFLLSVMHNVIALSVLFWCGYGERFLGRSRRWQLRQIWLSLILPLSLVAFGGFVMNKNSELVPPRLNDDGKVPTLEDLVPPVKSGGVIIDQHFVVDGPPPSSSIYLKSEARVDGQPKSQHSLPVQMVGFQPAKRWENRRISTFAEALESGEVNLEFAPAAATHVALLLVDGDSFQRIVIVSSGDSSVIAQDLHNGRWIVLPISEIESAAGRKQITLSKLLGESIAVARVVLYRAEL